MARSRGFANLIDYLRKRNESITDSFIGNISDSRNSPLINIYDHIRRRTPEGLEFARHYRKAYGSHEWEEFRRLVNYRYLSEGHLYILRNLFFDEGITIGNFGRLKRTTEGIGFALEVDHLLEDRIFRIFADGSEGAMLFGSRKTIENFNAPHPFSLNDLELGRTDSVSMIVPVDDIIMHQMLLADIPNVPYIHTHKTARINQLIPPGMESTLPLNILWDRQRAGLREFLPLDQIDDLESDVKKALITAVLQGVEDNDSHDLLCDLLIASTIDNDHLNVIQELRDLPDVIDVDSTIYDQMAQVLDDILEIGDESGELASNVLAGQFGTD